MAVRKYTKGLNNRLLESVDVIDGRHLIVLILYFLPLLNSIVYLWQVELHEPDSQPPKS